MTTCALCEAAIGTENDSEEHIIPQSIGGRRTVTRFVCAACNNQTGATWDNELFQQCHWFTVMLGTKRQRGPAQDIRVETLEGTTYAVSSNGAISHTRPLIQPSEDGKSFRIQARSFDEAKLLLRQLHKRHPKFDVEEVLSTSAFSSSPVEAVFKTGFEFGGELAGRSIVKTALALAYSLGVPPSACELVLPFLRKVDGAVPSLAEHFTSDLVVSRPARLFNCVAVHGDCRKRRLVGYVEYFGVCRWVIHLSNDYDGSNLQGVYCVDAITGALLAVEVDLSMSDGEFQASLDDRTGDMQSRLDAYNTAIPLVRQRRHELAVQATLDYAIAAALAAMSLKPDAELDASQCKEFSGRVARIVAESLVPRRMPPSPDAPTA